MTDADLTTETWKPVVGYEGIYEVSDWGRVRRLTHHNARWPAGRILNGVVGKVGYPVVALCRGTKADQRINYVHRLMVIAFIGPIPNNMSVNHIDGDKTNNILANLEIVSPQRQYDHAKELGLIRNTHGTQRPAAKLTEEVVSKIRLRYVKNSHKHGAARIAKELGIGKTTVRWALKRKTWKHVTE